MARPRKTWEQLRAAGTKPGVWKRRQLEDEPPAFTPEPRSVAAYVASIDRECQTYLDRCVPGEILTRLHDGSFNWQPSLLSDCRDFAIAAVSNPECPPWTFELSTRFLADLENDSHGCHLDVESARNVSLMFEVFADPEKPIPMLRKLAALEFLCWKSETNTPRFENELLLDFDEDDQHTIDLAILAERG
jgi:hypothetical protein